MPITAAQLRATLTGEVSLAEASPDGIRASEKRGQTMLVGSSLMPLEMREEKPLFEQLGFTFGAPVDDVFQEATLPEGWTRHATDHDMWSEIRDQHGRKRVDVFYKAAFYDRNAHARLIPRYVVSREYAPQYGPPTCITVEDAGTIILRMGLPDRPTDTGQREQFREYHEAVRAVDEKARAWLLERRPDFLNPVAYWDDADTNWMQVEA